MDNQERGRQWEKEIAKKLGAKVVPGSGNQPFRKLDVEGLSFLLSLKWTANSSIRLDHDTLQELQEATRGPSGTGAVPIAVTRVEEPQDGPERIYATLELDDLVAMFQEQITLVKESKRDAKYREAETPSLFREDH